MSNNQTDNYRPIRSFVRRQGRYTDAQKQAIRQYWTKYGIDFSGQPIDFNVIFGRSQPKTLEVGFGMGHSLLQMAKAHPEQDFIGIEVHEPGVGVLLQALAKDDIENVRVICHDAVQVLQQMVNDASLETIQVFFPDPWPKKRHHKRRLIQADFVRLLQRKLITGGLLHLATDWEDYAWHMLAVMRSVPGWQNLAGEKQFMQQTARPSTKYEMRGQRLGHQIWDLQFVKK